MNTGIGRKGKAGLVLALAAAGALFGPLAANAFDVVAGSTENSLSLRVFRGTESQGALAVDVVSAPAWVMSLSPASQVVSPSAAGSAMTEVSLSFDVDPSAAVGSQGELTLRIRSLEVSGMDATKTYHLVVATSAEGHQEILTADCCAALMTGTVFVPTQRSILFSVPLLPVPPATTFSPSQIGDDLGSPIFWTLRRWNPATSSLVTVTSMATGRAFFLRDNQGAPTESTLVDVDGAVLTSTLGFQTAQLDSGFQEIATPYLSAVSWGSNVNVTLGATTVPLDSAVTLGWVESAMYTLGADKSWDVTFADDVVPGTLQPWSGGLILPRVDNLVLSYAAAGAAAAAAAPYHWRVELVSTVAAQSLSDKHNRFGLALGAAVQKDKHDAVQPFNPEATYTDLFFTNPGWSSYPGNYMQDVHPAVIGTDSWDVGVTVVGFATQSVTITWPDLSEVPSPVGLFLIDPAIPDTTNMRTESSYTFTSGASGAVKALKVRIDASSLTDVRGEIAGAPKTFMLGSASPNPFNPTTEIRYGVPAGGGVIALRVYNVSGQLVRTLVDGQVAAGYHRSVWDGRNDNGQAVKAGVYFYRLETSTMRETKKMTLLK